MRALVGASHGITDLAHKLHFYDQWAPNYDQVNQPCPHLCSPPLTWPVFLSVKPE